MKSSKQDLKSANNIYSNIATDIKTKIINKVYLPGQMLPSEKDLMTMYESGRDSIRKSLEILSNDNFITKKQNLNYIINTPSLTDFSLKFDFSMYNEISRKINIEYCKNKKITQALNIKEGTPVIRIERLLCDDIVPVIFDIKYIPFKKGVPYVEDEIKYTEFGDIGSENISPFALQCDMQITAGLVEDNEVSRKLCTKLEEAVLILKRTIKDHDGVIYSFQRTIIRKDLGALNAHSGYSYENQSDITFFPKKNDNVISKEDLRRERINLFRNAAHFNHVNRIPNLANVGTWRVMDAGYKLSEAFNDYSIMEKCVRRFIENYPVDTMIDLGTRNPFKVVSSFGKGSYYYNDELSTVGMVPSELCTHEELLNYSKEPFKYSYEELLPRKYETAKDKTLADWQNTLNEYMKYREYSERMNEVVQKEYGLALPVNTFFIQPVVGIEHIFSVRGISGLSVDLNKDKGLLKQCIENLDEIFLTPVKEKMEALPAGADNEYCFDSSIMMLAHNFISPKQFGEFYWPSLKKIIDIIEEKDMTIRLMIEGSSLPYLDFICDYKKGTIVIDIENDNLINVRKKYPNLAISGGMKTTNLAHSSKEACVDAAKQLIDSMAEGYIFSTDKMLFYKEDAKAENLKAVFDFVYNYRI